MQHVQDDLRPVLAAERLLAALAPVPLAQDHDEAQAAALHASSGRVDIERVAQRLGIRIARLSPTLRPDTLGYLEPGEDLIFLRVGLPRTVWRFTLAHEIGHAALHRAWGVAAALARGEPLAEAHPAPVQFDNATQMGECAGSDFAAPLEIANGQDELLSPGQAYSAAARREQEANLFAAALLLPADALLRAYFSVAQAISGATPMEARPSGTIAQELARRFGVSEDVALRRLTALLGSLPGEQRAHREALATDKASPTFPATLASAPALDRAQRCAAEAQTPALVIAGPGAGKTSALLGRILHLITARNIAPSSILALTFSNKAARELQTRLRSALADRERLGAAPLEGFPTVNTIHGFCGEVLRRYGDLVGVRANYRLVSEVEGYFLLRQIARDLPLTHYHPLAAPTQYYPDLLAAISRAKDDLADPARYAAVAQRMLAEAQTPDALLAAERAHEVAMVYAAYQQALEARGDPDFGDIIRLTVRLLQDYPDALAALRSQYDELLVDEFQDINHAMAVLLRLLAGEAGPLWAVGDADQAIYRFRGAAPETLAHFTNDYPTANVLTLPNNYRSLPPILEAASSVAEAFLKAPQPRARHERLLAPTREASESGGQQQPIVTLANAPDDTTELANLADDIRHRIAAGRSPGEIAILCRTHRQAAQVVAALRHAAIPTLAPTPLFEQPIVKDILATLSLLVDLSGAGLLRAGALPDHAFTRAEAVVLLQAAQRRQSAPLAVARSRTQLYALEGVSPDGARGFERLRAMLAVLRRAPNVMMGLARYVFSLTGLGARLLGAVASGAAWDAEAEQDEAARQRSKAARQRAACLERLLALAHAYDEQRLAEAQANNLPAPAKADWAGFLDYIRTLITLRQRLGASDEPLTEESVEAVRVLTVHESKGLEFSVVYLPGLVNRRFPSGLQHERAPAPSGLRANPTRTTDTHQETREAIHLLEEACLFYVALTRARDTLVLSYARRYGRAVYHPSPFLAPIERRPGAQLARVTWRTHEHERTPLAVLDTPPEILDEARAATERTPDDSAMLLARRVDDLDGLATRHNQEPHNESSDAQTQDTHSEAQPETISIAALESALRCPRQYAYRALYGFGERQAGLNALRHGVQETLSGLHSRFAASHQGEQPAHPLGATHRSEATEMAVISQVGAAEKRATGGNIASAHEQSSATLTIPIPETPAPPTLDEARSLFDHHWELALNGAHNHTQSNGAAQRSDANQASAPGADATHAIYQRHGRQIAERLWRDAMQQNGLWDTLTPADSDHPAANTPATGLRPGAAREITVQMHGRPITGVLDHVEETSSGAQTPLRLAYYRTSGDDEPTLHDLFYTLAARQLTDDLAREGRPTPIEAIRYNLATGAAQPIALSPRQRERLERSLDEAFATLDRGVFPAKPEARRCQHCPFLLICPA